MSDNSQNNSIHPPAAQGNSVAVAPRPRASHEEGHAMEADLPRIPFWGIALIVLVMLLVMGAMFFLGWIPHQRRLAAAAADANAAARTVPIVEVVAPRQAPLDEPLVLPADVRANQSTAVFARTGGYLKALPAGIDIGSTVRAGQTIAEIAAPEVDAQLDQARAAVEQTRAAVKRAEQEHELAATTLRRYEDPGLGNAISKQEVDTRRSQESVAAAALAEATSNVAVAEANVKRLVELKGFTTIIAPFDGVITSRGYDAGALISTTDTGKPLFTIEQTDLLRVGVSVPQGYSTDIRIGQPAELLVSNFPGRSFKGAAARTAGSIDMATRTLRVEVDVPNPDHTLLPGMYGQVRFHVKRDKPTLILPTSALVYSPKGMTIATIESGHAKVKNVTLGRDFGQEAEIATGLAPTDVVINNPGLIADGAPVEIKPTPPANTPK